MKPTPNPNQRTSRRRYWFNLLRFFLLTALVVYYLVLPVAMAWVQTRPLPSTVEIDAQLKENLRIEDITVQTDDGLALRGWYIPPQNGAVILLFPGYGGDRRSVMPYAQFLAEAGFGVLMMDPRSVGESGGQVRAYGWTDWGDGKALVERLLQDPAVDPGRLGTFGCSTGAEIAVGAAALEPRIRAVVADAPFYATLRDISPPVSLHDWLSLQIYPAFLLGLKLFSGAHPPMALVDAVSMIEPRPLLLIAGERSEGGFETRQSAHFLARAGRHAEQWIIPDTDHCSGLSTQPLEYPQRVITFFKTSFGMP